MALDISHKENPFITILGASGGKAKESHLTSLQITENIVIDAGNLIDALGEDINNIEHILLSHTHLDHILDIPFLLDSTFEVRQTPLKIYAQKGNLEALKKHILNWEIWPDFTTIKIPHSNQFCLELVPIEINQPLEIDQCKFIPIANNHTPYSNGFSINKGGNTLLFTSDTYCCDTIWDTVNNDKSIKSIIIEVSFPSRFEKLAFDSKHLTPKLLQNELQKLQRDDVAIYINHFKPFYKQELVEEINSLELPLNGGSILQSNEQIFI